MEQLRKSDNKGRLAGFRPSTYYRTNTKDRKAIMIHEVFIGLELAEGTEVLNPEGWAYLESFGLDPKVILRDECYAEGYWEASLDETGNRVMEYGTTKKIRKPWPEGFDYHVFAAKALNLGER